MRPLDDPKRKSRFQSAPASETSDFQREPWSNPKRGANRVGGICRRILDPQSPVPCSDFAAWGFGGDSCLCEGTLFRGSNKGLKGNRAMLRLPHLETSPEPTCILEAVWNARSRWQRQTRPSCHLPFLFCTGPPNP